MSITTKRTLGMIAAAMLVVGGTAADRPAEPKADQWREDRRVMAF